MKQILIYGASLNNNLGIPSLLTGLETLLGDIFKKEDLNIYFVDSKAITESSNFHSKIIKFPFKNTYHFFLYAVFWIFFKSFLKSDKANLIRLIYKSDFVINLYGILFSSNLEGNQKGVFLNVLKTSLSDFII